MTDDYHVTIQPDAVRVPTRAYWEALERQAVPTTPTVLAGLALGFATIFGVVGVVGLSAPRRAGPFNGPNRVWVIGLVAGVIAGICYVLAAFVAWGASARGPQRLRRLDLATRFLSRLVPPESLQRKLDRLASHASTGVPSRVLAWTGALLVGVEGALVAAGAGPATLLAGALPLAIAVAMLFRQAHLAEAATGPEQVVRQRATAVLDSELKPMIIAVSVHLALVVLLAPVLT